MAKHVKNLQLQYEKRYQLIAHERPIKPDLAKGKLYDINFWKIFARMPRNNSNLQQNDNQQQESPSQQQRFMLISTFKNREAASDSPVKSIKNYKNQIKRYISDQGINFNRKISRNNIVNQEQVVIQSDKNAGDFAKTKQQQCSFSQQFSKSSMMPHSKRTVFSGNQSQAKPKYRINKEKSKKQNIGSIVQRISSKIKLPELKQQKKYPLLMRDPQELKDVKSQSYIVIQYPSQRVIVSHRSVVSLQIASLTKIMTFYTVYCLVEEKGIQMKNQTITVSPQVLNISGTSAQIIQGQIYTVQDLLYGLMLPSGNDAANQLAFWAGSLLATSDDLKSRQKAFITEMNRRARLIDLKNSKFTNPHGLPNQEARSTAADIAKLCCICMKIQLFKTIVSCKKYKATAKYQTTVRQVQWENTNKLLRREGFLGLKTGITVTAGPCLAAAYAFRDKVYISVVLRAPKVSGRFKETRLLLHWCLNKLFKQLKDEQKNVLKRLKRNDHELDSDYSQDEHEFNYQSSGAREYKKRANILNYQL